MNGQYATADAFRKLFAEGVTSLHLRAFLFTGNSERERSSASPLALKTVCG